mgnify:CR=1 FL=1
MKRIYLDNAASTPIAPEVISIMHKMMIEDFGNPSSIHSYGRTAKNIVENSRKKIADLLNTSPGSIFLLLGVLKLIIWLLIVLLKIIILLMQ